MDAYDIAERMKKYWSEIYPKNSGQLPKSKEKVKVLVNTPEGYREVVGISINENFIELKLDEE